MFETISQHEYPASKHRELVSKTNMLQTSHQTFWHITSKRRDGNNSKQSDSTNTNKDTAKKPEGFLQQKGACKDSTRGQAFFFTQTWEFHQHAWDFDSQRWMDFPASSAATVWVESNCSKQGSTNSLAAGDFSRPTGNGKRDGARKMTHGDG